MPKVRTIGRVAEEAGVNVETIRYYHRQELLPNPPKPQQGFREYPPESVERIRFIKRAQRLGFTLPEIRELLTLDDGSCKDVQTLAEGKLAEIDTRIEDLVRMRQSLSELLQQCREGTGKPGCPLIRSVSSPREGQAG